MKSKSWKDFNNSIEALKKDLNIISEEVIKNPGVVPKKAVEMEDANERVIELIEDINELKTSLAVIKGMQGITKCYDKIDRIFNNKVLEVNKLKNDMKKLYVGISVSKKTIKKK